MMRLLGILLVTFASLASSDCTVFSKLAGEPIDTALNVGQLQAQLKKRFPSGEEKKQLREALEGIQTLPVESQKIILGQILHGNLSVAKVDLALAIARQDFKKYDLAGAVSSGTMPPETIEIKVREGKDAKHSFRKVTTREADGFLREKGLGKYRSVDEGPTGQIFDKESDVVAPGPSQCRAVFILNHDTGKVFVYHSSSGMGQDQFPVISKLGTGRKSAFIVGAWSGRNEARLLTEWLGIPSVLVHIEDAETHVNVLYSGKDNTIRVGYGNPRGGYFIGTFQAFAPEK
jgi:hypothetical protein